MLAPLSAAVSGQLAVLSNPKYLSAAKQAKCSAVIVPESLWGNLNDTFPAIVVDNAESAWIELARHFLPARRSLVSSVDCRSQATIDPSATVHPSAVISPGVVIGADVQIGQNVFVGAGTTIGPKTTIGSGCVLYPNVTILDEVVVGMNSSIASGAVIGSEGFGFFMLDQQWKQIPHLGSVVIGNNVTIGANTAIDRGTLESTLIGDGVILDNQIHIAHNVKIGQCTAIAGATNIAGSATIGQYCRIGGASLIAGHITICDHVDLLASSSIRKSICAPGVYSSIFGHLLPQGEWSRATVHLKNISKIVKKMNQWMAGKHD